MTYIVLKVYSFILFTIYGHFYVYSVHKYISYDKDNVPSL